MRERGHSPEGTQGGRHGEGKLAFGMAEDIFADPTPRSIWKRPRRRSGSGVDVIERVMTVMGTPSDREQSPSARDIEAFRRMGRVAEAGLPVEALLQLTRGVRPGRPTDRRRRGPALPSLRP